MSDSSEPPMSDGGRRTGWAELASGETVELARSGQRCAARILDFIIVSVFDVAVALFIVLGESDDAEQIADRLTGVFLWSSVLFLVYEVVQVALWGRTLGKRMVGIKVVNAAHGGVPGWGKAVGRWAIPGLVYLIPIVGPLAALLCYISLTWDRVYQGWHDKAAGTLVVRT